MKRCRACKKLKSLDKFGINKDCKTDGRMGTCKKCKNKQYKQNWYKTHKKQCQKVMLRNTYGLTLEQYDKMLEEQGDVCAICGGINKNGRRLAVDHNHKTGKVRGLLCTRCNASLGIIEQPNYLLKLMEYLQLTGS